MSALEAFLLVAAVASIVAVPLAIYYARRQAERQKLLAYDGGITRLPLISPRSLAEYKLSVVYQPEGGEEERISGAYVHFLRFANFGREPIRREDIAPHNRLRIEVRGARVLDFTLEAVRRTVNNISVEADIPFEDDIYEATIDFDFLDYRDGALVRLVTTSRPSNIALVGDVIGMPGGVKRAAEVGRRSFWTWAGGALSTGALLAGLASTAFVFRWVTGAWVNVWLLTTPIVALIVTLVIIVVVSETIWPKSGLQFPRELVPRRGLFTPHGYMRATEMGEIGPVWIDMPDPKGEDEVDQPTAGREEPTPG
jgi:hypothetical protein